MASSDRSQNEKADVAQDEFGIGSVAEDPPHSRHGHSRAKDEIDRIDALATAEGTTLNSFSHLDEKAILRKMDLRLIPMLSLLYLLSFLDRGNIGNAKIEGLQEDLGMRSYEYNWCLTAFFFTYAAFEVPSNLLLKKLRPSRWLPIIMVAWGTVMTLMGIVRNYQGLLAARLFLGVTEAGLYRMYQSRPRTLSIPKSLHSQEYTVSFEQSSAPPSPPKHPIKFALPEPSLTFIY
jgi:hypothetical protein